MPVLTDKGLLERVSGWHGVIGRCQGGTEGADGGVEQPAEGQRA